MKSRTSIELLHRIVLRKEVKNAGNDNIRKKSNLKGTVT